MLLRLLGQAFETSQRAWMVPAAALGAVLAGGAAAYPVWTVVAPTGDVQSTLTTPVTNLLSVQGVIDLVGPPFASLVAAVTASVGGGRRRAWPYALLGAVLGVAVMVLVAAESVTIGRWWIDDVGADTNRAAALFALLLAPPATVAVVLSFPTARGPADLGDRGETVARAVQGGLVGLMIGALFGGFAAVETWAIHVPVPVGFGPQWSPSDLLSFGAVLGGLVGSALGVPTGVATRYVRLLSSPTHGRSVHSR